MTYPDTLQQVGIPSRQAHHGGVGPGHPCIRHSVIEQSRGQVFHVCCDGQLTLRDVVRSGWGIALTVCPGLPAWLSGTSRGHSQAIAPSRAPPPIRGQYWRAQDSRLGEGRPEVCPWLSLCGPTGFTSPLPVPG